MVCEHHTVPFARPAKVGGAEKLAQGHRRVPGRPGGVRGGDHLPVQRVLNAMPDRDYPGMVPFAWWMEHLLCRWRDQIVDGSGRSQRRVAGSTVDDLVLQAERLRERS